MDRKACKREVKATLRTLDNTPGDRLTRRWLAVRCSRCFECPKIAKRAVITLTA